MKIAHWEQDQVLQQIALRNRAMGNPVRLLILEVLRRGEASVSEILSKVGGSQANVSKNLGVLWAAGLVRRRRSGTRVDYRVSDEGLVAIVRVMTEILARQAGPEMDAPVEARPTPLTAGP